MSNAPQILFTGDASEGLKYLPFAKQKLAAIKTLGQMYVTRHFNINNTAIRLTVSPFGDKIHINVSSACPVIQVNGFIDTFDPVVYGPPPLPVTPQLLIDKQIEEELREVVVAPNTVPVPSFYGVRKTSDFNTLTNTTKLRTENGSAVFNESTQKWDAEIAASAANDFKTTYARLIPSKFTGLMRRVVQATLSTDAWRAFAPTLGDNPAPAAAPINYEFGDSWGCLKSTQDGKTKYHFIQIAGDSAYYVPATYCTHKVKVDGVDADAVILRHADVKNKVKIGSIPSGLGGSWSKELGWAFSYTTPEASIVLNSTTFVGAFEYVTVSLATLVFSYSDGVPSAAAFSATTPKILFYNAFMNKRTTDGGNGYFHVPQRIEGQLINVTVDFGLQILGHPFPPNYNVSDIPVYVYYTETEKKILGWTYQTIAATSVTKTAPADLFVRLLSMPSTEYYYWYVQTPLLEQRIVGEALSGAVIYGFSLNGIGLAAARRSESSAYMEYLIHEKTGRYYSTTTTTFVERVYHYTTTGPNPAHPNYPIQCSGTTGPTLDTAHTIDCWAVPDYYRASRNNKTVSGGGAFMRPSATLSVDDRECALLLTRTETDVKTTTNAVTHGVAKKYSSGGNSIWANGIPGDTEDAVGREMFYRAMNVGPSTQYNTCATCSNTTVNSVVFDRHQMQLAATGQPIDDQWTVAFSDPVRMVLDGFGVSAPFALSGCGFGTNYNITMTLNQGPYEYAYASTDIVPALVTFDYRLFSHNEPITLAVSGLTTRLFWVLPDLDFTLSYRFMQAAFNPKNYVMQRGDFDSPLDVRYDGMAYQVEHALYGWIGAV